jgi:hypothetical protein
MYTCICVQRLIFYLCIKIYPVLEYDRKPTGELGAMGNQVLKRRFESYNKSWLAAMGGTQTILHGQYYDLEDEDMGLADRLPSAQEHELSMITTAKYLVRLSLSHI